MTNPLQPAIAQAIYDGIRDVFPVDLTQTMGEKRAREYQALWANAATKRLLGGVLPAPGAEVDRFRAALVAAVRGAEAQTMGLGPDSGDWLSAMADFIADFEPKD